MRTSFDFKLSSALIISSIMGIAGSGYVLLKFKDYERGTNQALSGDHKIILTTQVIESKLKALLEFDGNYIDDIKSIIDQLKSIQNENAEGSSDASISHLRKNLENEIQNNKSDINSARDEIFTSYKNIKLQAFQIYKLAWNNKWLNVAKTVGLIMSELDANSHQDGLKIIDPIYSKINQLTQLIGSSKITTNQKVLLFGQLTSLKNLMDKFKQQLEGIETSKLAKKEVLSKSISIIHRFNESHTKSLTQFIHVAHSLYLKSVIAFLSLTLLSMGWFVFIRTKFKNRLKLIVGHIKDQLEEWIGPSGNPNLYSFSEHILTDNEFKPLYKTIDDTVKKLNSLRKEDVFIKKVLNVPILVIHKSGQALFWNTALSILIKIKSIDELGPTAVSDIFTIGDKNLHLASLKNPIDEVFENGKEIIQDNVINSSAESVSVELTCTPVFEEENKVEYVVVQIKDLSIEKGKIQAQVHAQMQIMNRALDEFQNGIIPDNIQPLSDKNSNLHLEQDLVQGVSRVKNIALEQQQRLAISKGQVQTVMSRVVRESDIKKSVYQRMKKMNEEVVATHAEFSNFYKVTEQLIPFARQVEDQSKKFHDENKYLKTKIRNVLDGIKDSRKILDAQVVNLDSLYGTTEKIIRAEHSAQELLEKAMVLNANNSIVASKHELNPQDLIMFTDHIGQMISIFQKSYKTLSSYCSDLQKEINLRISEVKVELNRSYKFISDDSWIIRELEKNEQHVKLIVKDLNTAFSRMQYLSQKSNELAHYLSGIETKSKNLVQIADASLQLQEQLELGFKGISEHLIHSTSKSALPPRAH